VALLLLVTPLANEAQQLGKMPRVGVLAAGSASEAPNTTFFDRMRELGYLEGQTVIFERALPRDGFRISRPSPNNSSRPSATSSSLPSLPPH